MPTYQYACTMCDHELEAVQSFSDDPLTVCPECAGRLRKVFSAVGVVFKGSGFYRNDSRAGKTAGSAASGTKTESKSETSTSASNGSSESKSSSGSSTSSAKSSSKSAATTAS
ncbi:MAG: FmdB family zinc ribbon protein [Micromonosporaceae bacterium]